MSRSAIYTVNNTIQNVAVDGNINPGVVTRKFGNNLSLEGVAIRECGTGYYKYCASFTIAPTTEGNVTVTAFKDGVAIPGATASGTAAAAGDFVNLNLVFITREFCGCCEDISNITFTLGETASSVTNVGIAGEKL